MRKEQQGHKPLCRAALGDSPRKVKETGSSVQATEGEGIHTPEGNLRGRPGATGQELPPTGQEQQSPEGRSRWDSDLCKVGWEQKLQYLRRRKLLSSS